MPSPSPAGSRAHAPSSAMPEVMLPRAFRVVRRRRETADTVTLGLAATDGVALAFQPGQFTMLGAFGIGEVPVSISGDPAEPELLWHTVRDVRGITRHLVAARRDDVLTVRGPFGTGWQPLDGAGGDLVIVAGGIGLAPLRPAVLQVLADRERFGRVHLLYGSRTPADLLYRRELEGWRGRFDVNVQVTVDAGTPQWRGRVGLVTALLERASFDPAGTLALVCGPEVMIRFVATGLTDAGVPPEAVRVSLERNMRCGVGLCGHCQLRELFLCMDGPVLGYHRVSALLSRREV
jgi:NAD(P)H-flavin reductase